MSSIDFALIQIASGKLTFNQSTVKKNRYPVVFETPFDGVPTVVVSPVKSNQEAVAGNLTRTGFDIILSMDWCNEPTEFEIHYQAFFVR